MSKKAKIALFSVVILIVLVMIFVNLKKSRGNTIEVTLGEVKRGDITNTVSGNGQVQPEVDVDISARISAEIIKIHVEEGEMVTKGQLLVELDRQRYEAAVEQMESQRMSARAELKKAQADFSRTKNLFDQNLSSQADLDAAEANRMLAQSRVQQSEAGLKQSKDDLAKTRLMAPMSGTITRLLKEEGEIAVGSQFQSDPIMSVADLSRMEVLAEIDENDVVLVKLGDKTSIEVDAIPDTLLEGIVSEIAHTASTRGQGTQEQVTNFEVKIAITSPSEKLRPGMSSTVDISTETHKDVLFVPIQCVTVRDVKKDSAKGDSKEDKSSNDNKEKDNPENQNNSDYNKSNNDKNPEVVFVVKDGVAKVVAVETGISDDNNIEILSGLDEKEEIVTGSYKALSKELKDGSKVKVKKGMSFRENEETE